MRIIKNKLRMSGSNQYGPQIIAVTFKKGKTYGKKV